MAHRLSSGAAVTPPAAAAAAAAEAEPEAAVAADEDMYDEPGMGDAMADEGVEPMQADEPAPAQHQQEQQPAAAAVKQEQQQQDTPGGGGAGPAAAAGKTPWRTPAPVFNEAKTPATAGPASGWQLLYQDGEGEEAAAAGAGHGLVACGTCRDECAVAPGLLRLLCCCT